MIAVSLDDVGNHHAFTAINVVVGDWGDRVDIRHGNGEQSSCGKGDGFGAGRTVRTLVGKAC